MYISPQINGCKEEIQVKEDCPDACILNEAALFSLFQVSKLDSFRDACSYVAQLHCTPMSFVQRNSEISKLDIKQLQNYPADRYIFIIDNQSIPAPESWNGDLQEFFALVCNIERIAQTVNTLSNTQGSGTTIYKQVLRIPNDELDDINSYLNMLCEGEYRDENTTITHTAKFPDGRKMLINCYRCPGHYSWTDAFLVDSREKVLAATKSFERYSGLWSLECNGITYIVNIVPADSDSTKAPPQDETGICPVCGTEIHMKF